ncbi:MAG: hypothetical protein RJQ08_11605 [Salinisphaeraceae bacterium]
MASDSTGVGPVLRTFRLALILAVIVLGAQLYLNKPEDRSIVACWPLYLGYKAIVVDVWQLILPKEHRFHLKGIAHTSWMHDQCLLYTGYLPGFEERLEATNSG